MTDSYEGIHSCNYRCMRPACMNRQRLELWNYVQQIYDAVRELEPNHRMTMEQVMRYAVEKLRAKHEVPPVQSTD